MRISIKLIIIQVGKQLNLTTQQKHLQFTIGTDQLGHLNRRIINA